MGFASLYPFYGAENLNAPIPLMNVCSVNYLELLARLCIDAGNCINLGDTTMRKIVLALAAVGALGLALPVVAPANAREEGKIVIRTGDRHHERHWDRGRHEGRFERHRFSKVVIIKRRHHRDHD